MVRLVRLAAALAVLSATALAQSATPSASIAPFPRRSFGYNWSSLDAWMAGVAAGTAAGWPSPLFAPYSSFGLLVGNSSHLLYRSSVGAVDWAESVLVGTASQWVSAAVIYRAMELTAAGTDRPNTTPIGNYLTLPAGLRSVTLPQLLSHTGGIASTLNCTEAGINGTVPARSSFNFSACIGSLLVAHNASTPAALPQGPPGTRYFFNGGSMQLAAAAAMAASARTRDAFSEDAWGQLTGTYLRSYFSIPDGSISYIPSSAGFGGNPAITHGLRIRPHDYGQFLQSLLNASFLVTGGWYSPARF